MILMAHFYTWFSSRCEKQLALECWTALRRCVPGKAMTRVVLVWIGRQMYKYQAHAGKTGLVSAIY